MIRLSPLGSTFCFLIISSYDMVADIEVDMVADIEVDMMAEILSLSTA